MPPYAGNPSSELPSSKVLLEVETSLAATSFSEGEDDIPSLLEKEVYSSRVAALASVLIGASSRRHLVAPLPPQATVLFERRIPEPSPYIMKYRERAKERGKIQRQALIKSLEALSRKAGGRKGIRRRTGQ